MRAQRARDSVTRSNVTAPAAQSRSVSRSEVIRLRLRRHDQRRDEKVRQSDRAKITKVRTEEQRAEACHPQERAERMREHDLLPDEAEHAVRLVLVESALDELARRKMILRLPENVRHHDERRDRHRDPRLSSDAASGARA